MKGPAVLVAVVVAVVAVAAAGAELVDWIGSMSPEARAEARAEELRDRIREMRPHLESCVEEMERTEVAFRAQEQRTEELRSRVEALEELDAEGERGVPSDRYEEYLEVFDRYNASLPEWERRAALLQEVTATCRALAEGHNARADSLREILVEADLWDEDRFPPLVDPDG